MSITRRTVIAAACLAAAGPAFAQGEYPGSKVVTIVVAVAAGGPPPPTCSGAFGPIGGASGSAASSSSRTGPAPAAIPASPPWRAPRPTVTR